VPKTTDNVAEIFRNDKDRVDRCQAVGANLNGIITDDGTAWALRYADASGKYLIGLHTDWRRRFDDKVVNLMIECLLKEMVHSLHDLTSSLAAWRFASD
jgi:nucleoside 2-deoxyribosyltransferase